MKWQLPSWPNEKPDAPSEHDSGGDTIEEYRTGILDPNYEKVEYLCRWAFTAKTIGAKSDFFRLAASKK